MIAHYSAYDEVIEFIASMDPSKLVQFKASDKMQERVDALLEKNQEEHLTDAEHKELEHYLMLDHLISLAKARAQKLLNQRLNAPA